MTIERPMFPPRAESPNVIEFPTGATVLPAESKFAALLQRSKLEVVERKPSRRAKVATAKHYIEANATFEAWERLPEIMETFGKEWPAHGVEVRIAYGAMTSPQSALEGIHEDIPHAEVDTMMANICRTAEILKFAGQFMDLALIRLVAAATAVEARGTLKAG
jgi:hypothetical protein